MESTTVLKVVILACLVCACTGQRKIIKNIQFGAEVKQEPDFSCPEEFGYYPHPTDCTQYYVCVFGGALLESCTGGLKYSHELQTCDWPRNVGCDAGVSESQGPVRTVPQSIRISSVQKPQVQTQPQSQQRQRVETPSSRYQPQLVQRNPQHHVQPQLSQQDYQLIKERERQQQLYAESDEETLPAEEVESERQQRVYRGQPSTVGQVQRDRDGVAIRHSNAISNTNDQEEKIRAVSYRTSQLSQEAIPLKQYSRVDPSLSSDRYISAPPASVTSMANTGPVVFNNSRSIDNNQYDNHYWDVYDDDVDLYRDVDYGQNYSPNSQETLQDNRPTPAPVVQNHHQQAYSPTPNNIYNSDINVYHNVATQDYSEEEVDQYQSARQPIRGNKNDLSYDAVPSIVPVSSTSRTTTSTSTTTSTTTTNRPSTSAYVRGNIRNRGQAVHRTQTIDNTVSVNRGTPPTRVRSTLKPSTSIISKATEFVDIYKYPPRRPAPIYPTPIPDKTAAKCRKDVCLLPDCSCGGKEIPGGLPVEQVPQLVLLTFDDSVNDLNKGLYQDLFERGRVNPNGCPLAATFYVSHEWTDYSQVQNLYSNGHEIASHTVSHSFGEQFSQKKWNREVSGQREILSAYGGVRLEDIRGMRAPFLSVGGNKMFKMLYDSNFTYDSSMPVYENKPPSWPYTLDYKLFHDCMIPPCPTRSYPGVWEVPMVMWQDLKEGRCSMADACSNPPNSDGVVKMLMKNFDRHYTSNRAPFGLYYHAAWFTQPHHKEGFIKFLDTINSLPDVYLVTNWQALQWVRDPTPLSRLHNFQPFQCDYPERPKKCNNPKVCNLWHKSGVRYMRTCQPCPDIYPWTGKTGIKSSRIDNDIEK